MSGLSVGAIGSALQSSEPNSTVARPHPAAFNAALDKAGAMPPGGVFAYANRPIIDIGSGSGTVIPATNADPQSVAAWWSTLSAGTRQKLMAEHYTELGKLRGLPAEDIDKINRKRLDVDLAPQRRLNQVEFEISARQDATKYGDGHVDPQLSKLYQERDHLKATLSNATDVKKQMDILDADYADGKGPKPYLLTYDQAGDGRFAVALGNPDTADNTTVLVPGAGHDVKKEDGHQVLFPTVQEGQRLYDAMAHEGAGQPGDNSVIVWLGADMPDSAVPDGLNPTYGDSGHGARWLHDDAAGYQAAITNSDNHTTLVAHSYGSYMASGAVKLGLRVDDLVVIGSPGLVARNAGELGMQGHVWAGRASDDELVTHGWLGSNPTSESFGAEVFSTDGAKDHNDYLNDGSESLENIAKIAAGQSNAVSRREPDTERTALDFLPTTTT
jgi:hypothetical protein